MRNEIITVRYGKRKSFIIWKLTEPDSLKKFQRYFEKNKSLGYQYDTIGRTPMIRFGVRFECTGLAMKRDWYTCATSGKRCN